MGEAISIARINDFYSYDCWVCGIPFVLTRGYDVMARQQEKAFYCPNGCRLAFGESETTKLKRELEQVTRARDAAREREQSLRLTNDRVERKLCLVTKKLKRVENGTCPECNRSFADLRRHMAKHQPVEPAKEVRR